MTTLAIALAALAVLTATPMLVRRLAGRLAAIEAGTFAGLSHDLDALLDEVDEAPMALAA